MSPTISTGIPGGLETHLWRYQDSRVVVPVPERHGNVLVATHGPRTRPLLYTGLRCPPSRLTWQDAPSASAFYLTLSAASGRWEQTEERPCFRALPARLFAPEESVQWRLTPQDHPERAISGCCWVLTGERLARLEEAQQVVARVEDLEMRAIAQAITAAEFGLYDEAVTVLDALLRLMPLKGRGALAHRALITIFTEMKEKMPPDGNSSAGIWAQERLAAHHDALARCLPLPAGRAPARAVRPGISTLTQPGYVAV